MANLIRSLIENDKKELKRLDSIAKKVEAYADQMAALTDTERCLLSAFLSVFVVVQSPGRVQLFSTQ